MSNADEILKLKELLDAEIITREEFEKKKKELLDNNINMDKTEENITVNNITEKKKKTGISTIISYIIGIFFIISGFANITSNNVIDGIIGTTIGLIILPAFNNFLEKQFNFKLSKSLKIVICIILFCISLSS